MALYLPEVQDLRYQEYLASLPAYKAKLEERYPQVCAECAPRARERIKQASYVAKTDHIRRMMAGTRAGAMPLRDGAWWRLWVIRLGGIGWWTSAAAQTAWHVLGAIMQPQGGDQLQAERPPSQTISVCARQAWKTHEANYACVTSTARHVPLLLAISLLTIWWNPQLSDKYLGRRKGRMVGLADYYAHCVVTIIIRGVAWWLLRDWTTFGVRDDMYKGGHLFMIVFIVVTAGYGYSVVKLDTNPVVSFHISDDQILPGVPEREPNAPPAPRSLRSTQPNLFQQVPISSSLSLSSATQPPLAGNRGQIPQPSVAEQRSTFQPHATPNHQQPSKSLFSPSPSAARGSTPDPDAMDWSPSQNANTLAAANFRQRAPTPQKPIPFSVGPSPFQSRIPAAPPNRMRHPQEKAVIPPAQPFRKASDAQQRNFFREMTESREQKQTRAMMQQRDWDGSEASTLPNLHGRASEDDDEDDEQMGIDRKSPAKGAGSAGDFRLGPQRLFLKSDDRDTGLENMFDEVFRFQDEPGVQDVAAGAVGEQDIKRGGGVFGLNATTGTAIRRSSDANGRSSSMRLWSAVLVGMVPAVILGIVAVGVKMWRNSLMSDDLAKIQEP